MKGRRLVFSPYPYEIILRYVALCERELLISVGDLSIKARLRIPFAYPGVDNIKEYLKGYRMLHHYLKVEPAKLLPIKVGGTLYVRKEDFDALRKFLLTEFWDYCLNLGDFGRIFSSADVMNGLLRFSKPLVVSQDLYVEPVHMSGMIDMYFCYLCPIDFDAFPNPACLFSIKDLEELRKEKSSERRIFIPTEIEPREVINLGPEGEEAPPISRV